METHVWGTTFHMRDRKFFLYYRMSYEAFNNLVEELTPFLKSQCMNPVTPQLEIRKLWLLSFTNLLMAIVPHIWVTVLMLVLPLSESMWTLFVMLGLIEIKCLIDTSAFQKVPFVEDHRPISGTHSVAKCLWCN